MSTESPITDQHTVTTAALKTASGLGYWALWRHVKLGNLAKPKRRPGVRQNFWTEGQANRFLVRVGKEAKFKG